MALGWGLWEGPARFYFQASFSQDSARFTAQQFLSNRYAIDFQFKWHNIRHGKPPRFIKSESAAQFGLALRHSCFG